jgi:hypothetical protein
MQELLALHRFALRSGDRRLAEALARAMRSDPALRRQLDLHLQLQPRGPGRRSVAAERAVTAALGRIDTEPR